MRHHRLYLLLNVLAFVLLVLFTWLLRPHEGVQEYLALTFAQVAALLFLTNLNLYFTTLVIRKSPLKEIKIRFVKISRQLMRYHIPLAITGAALILLHGGLMLLHYASLLGWTHPKLITGWIALLLLAVNMFAGLLRHQRASGRRRKFHLYMAMTFACSMLLHLLWPL